ncbi:MAG: metal ABC transporter permease [Spirochaetales bacterium]|nr:metal ABC transporter permease [Spirochaetales bacterium]
MMELLELAPVRRALAALFVTGAAFPSLGVFILALELVPARFAVMHASLLGAALGLLAGVDPLPPALLAAVLAGFGAAKLSERGSASAGGPLGLFMVASLALAFIVFHKADVNAIEAFDLFWGSVLALSPSDLGLVVAGGVAIVVPVVLFLPELRAVLFDRVLARTFGIPAAFIHYALVSLVCLGIALAMRVTGALMVDAVTILPALAARSLGKGLGATLAWGAVFGVLANFAGFALAVVLDLPTSPAIIVVGVLLVAGTALYARLALRRA